VKFILDGFLLAKNTIFAPKFQIIPAMKNIHIIVLLAMLIGMSPVVAGNHAFV